MGAGPRPRSLRSRGLTRVWQQRHAAREGAVLAARSPERGHSDAAAGPGHGKTALAGPARGNRPPDGAAAAGRPEVTRRPGRGGAGRGRALPAAGLGARPGLRSGGAAGASAAACRTLLSTRPRGHSSGRPGRGARGCRGADRGRTARCVRPAVPPGNRALLPGGQAAAGGWRFPRSRIRARVRVSLP